MSNVVKGIATLRITREDSKWVPFYVEIDIDSCDSDLYEPSEEFQLLETDTLPCPDAAYKLEVGESVTVEVGYEFTFTQDPMTLEWDCDLEYTSQKVVK